MKTSKELFEACQQSDRKGQESLYQLLYVDLMRIAMRYTLNECDAQDVLNKAMFKVFTKIADFSGNHENFGGWIKRILVNECIDFTRSKKSLKKVFAENESLADIFHGVQPDENPNYILKLLEALPEKGAQVFNLYVIEGYSHKEISELLDISEANSKWQLHAVRRQLREWIIEKDLI